MDIIRFFRYSSITGLSICPLLSTSFRSTYMLRNVIPLLASHRKTRLLAWQNDLPSTKISQNSHSAYSFNSIVLGLLCFLRLHSRSTLAHQVRHKFPKHTFLSQRPWRLPGVCSQTTAPGASVSVATGMEPDRVRMSSCFHLTRLKAHHYLLSKVGREDFPQGPPLPHFHIKIPVLFGA